MTTRQLYYLVTISESSSLSEAAGKLGISQPALSKFLREYEDFIGFHLFLRSRRQMSLTSVGRYVLECAQRILDEQARLLQTLRAAVSLSRIRLATAPNRGAIIYSRIYNQFSRRYPDIALTLTELYASEQPGAILHGQVDLAIGSGKVSDKVTDIPFAREELLVSLPVSHPLSRKPKIRLSDLSDTPFVLQGPKHSIRFLAQELFREAGFEPVIAFESNDVLLVDSMLHQAVGAGLVSQAHVFPCEELVYRPLDPPVYQTLHIRYPLGHTLTGPERCLAGLLIRQRLSDTRYTAIPSPQAEELMAEAAELDGKQPALPAPFSAPTARASQSAPEINLNTQLLQYITAIAEEHSLTRAAERYYLSQPALSRCLRGAEDMVGTRLFTRVHNRLSPTNAGKIFVNFARNMLQIESEMEAHIQDYRKGRGGSLYIQCDPILTARLKGGLAAAFNRLHPDVALCIEENSRDGIENSLLNASADLGLYFSCQAEHPVLDCRPIAESRLAYCFGLPLPKGGLPGTVFPASLAPRPVMLAPAETALRQEQERLLQTLFTPPPTPSQAVPSSSSSDRAFYPVVCEGRLDILRLLAQNGAADVILPTHSLPPDAAGRSCPLSPAQPFFLLLARHPGRRLPSPARDLTRLLCQELEDFFTVGSRAALRIKTGRNS